MQKSRHSKAISSVSTSVPGDAATPPRTQPAVGDGNNRPVPILDDRIAASYRIAQVLSDNGGRHNWFATWGTRTASAGELTREGG